MVAKKIAIEELKNYIEITVGLILYSIGWTVFLLPNDITTGGVPGIASIVYFATGLPVQFVYFPINFTLLIIITGKAPLAPETLTACVCFPIEVSQRCYIL